MLNTIWCVSPINETTGGTEFLLGSQHSEAPPSGEEFDKKHMVIDANPGDVVMFDSRVWHRAGKSKQGVEERIIFTPIYSRPFIKPGFDYVKSMEKSENLEEALHCLSNCVDTILTCQNHTRIGIASMSAVFITKTRIYSMATEREISRKRKSRS